MSVDEYLVGAFGDRLEPAMSNDNGDDGDWEFYPCLVDDRPASIFVNLRYEHRRPSSFSDTLYWLRIHMLDVAAHGMGSAAEADALYPLEDALTAAAANLGLTYVGRLRNDGEWQLTFYGRPDHRDALDALAQGLSWGGDNSRSDPSPMTIGPTIESS